MGETLEALRRLQEVELKIAAIRLKQQAKQRRIALHKRDIERSTGRLDQQNRQTRELQVQLDALSLDVASREESVNKHREALNCAKTNKEYGAILAAMNTEKADASKLESSILEFMEQIQQLDGEAAEMETERSRLNDRLKVAEAAAAEYDT